MNLFAVSTIVRGASGDAHSAFMRLVDLDRGQVVATVAVPQSRSRAADPNARGGHRGARGVGGLGDRFVAAVHDRLFVLDPAWRLVREMSHPWIGGIHDILVVEDGIWINATASSLLAKLDWEGNLAQRWYWASDVRLARELGFRRPPAFHDSLDYRGAAYGLGAHDVIHMNSVVADGDRLLLSFGQIRSPAIQRWQGSRAKAMRLAERLPGPRQIVGWLRERRMNAGETQTLPAPSKRAASHAIVALQLENGRPGTASALWHQGGVTTPKHNVARIAGSLVFNDSEVGLAGLDTGCRELAFTIPIPGSPPFSRGLAVLDEGQCLVGSQWPAAVHRVDVPRREVIQSIELGGRPRETVYAISQIPDGFATDAFDGFGEWAEGLTLPT